MTDYTLDPHDPKRLQTEAQRVAREMLQRVADARDIVPVDDTTEDHDDPRWGLHDEEDARRDAYLGSHFNVLDCMRNFDGDYDEAEDGDLAEQDPGGCYGNYE